VVQAGSVYGVLMNHPQALAALGDAVHRPPYKAPPSAPVLYMKPRHTRLAAGQAPAIAAGSDAMWLEASLGIVIGARASGVRAADAFDVIAGYAPVLDLCLPHESFYRPSVRCRARDASLAIGAVTPRAALRDPDALAVEVFVDGKSCQRSSTAGRVRGVARLIEDITAFMTLEPGDVLLLGPAPDPPLLRTGQRGSVVIEGAGRLELPAAVGELA
jgi:5-oxopent-3-ene-1,2,5-tricarboxylate decarboxylase/2-hydroxyhepta-2,4-diene-1,7-dioate isomerase